MNDLFLLFGLVFMTISTGTLLYRLFKRLMILLSEIKNSLTLIVEDQKAIRTALGILTGEDFIKNAVQLAAAKEVGKEVLYNDDGDTIIGFPDSRYF